MFLKNLTNKNIILASKSPRRQRLLKDLGIPFNIHPADIDEVYPDHLKAGEIPVFLAEKKALSLQNLLQEDTIIISADTIVWMDNKTLDKPDNRAEAIAMLRKLSGRKHHVYSGVCILTKQGCTSFYSCTNVHFKKLSDDEIHHYIETCKPFDKAGAYGIQEWIGYIGIEKLEGSYFNVVGLPVQQLYEELKKIC